MENYYHIDYKLIHTLSSNSVSTIDYSLFISFGPGQHYSDTENNFSEFSRAIFVDVMEMIAASNK